MFNIIARKTLIEYIKVYPEAKTALEKWYIEILNADFKNFNELKISYKNASIIADKNASIIADDRVVFNIMGNKYRLVVRIVFEFKAVQIKWFGTHSEYDKIDVSNIKFKRK